jgi:IclR family transcriptional regulator, acetate operon repressor
MSEAAGTQAIERAAGLLVRVVESGAPIAVGELAATSGLPKSTTSRLIGALERQGLLQRDGQRGRLRPGPVLLRFAHRADATLVELAEPALQRLAAASGETVNLGVATPTGVEHLAQRDTRHFVGVGNWIGRRVPLHATANGKVFLAWEAVPVPDELERLAPRTITERKRLERELRAIRGRGFATATDELEQGLSALAAPVFGPDGDVVAALSVSGPTLRLTGAHIGVLAPVLVEQALALSERLGYTKRGAA